MKTTKDLLEYLRRYSQKASVIILNQESEEFELRWSLSDSEFVDSDGYYQVLLSEEEYSKVRIKDYTFILYCYQENGVPIECTLYIKDTKDSTISYVGRMLKKFF